MRSHITSLIQFILLLVPAAALVSSTSRGQAFLDTPYTVAGRFEAGDAPQSVRFVFSVQPATRMAPLVRLLGETAHQDSISLTPDFDRETALYSVTFELSPANSERRLQIELAQTTRGLTDIHLVTIAQREHATSGPMSRSSVDGNFALYTTPESLPAQAQILIAALELPLEQLPPATPLSDVLSVHTVTYLNAPDGIPDDWKITIDGSSAMTASPILLFLPNGGRDWLNLDVTLLPEHSLIEAKFNGPGTYLLLRKATQ